MHCLQHVFHRGALALALLAVGIGGGYGLHQPDNAANPNCRDAIARTAPAIGGTGYAWLRASDNSSRNADQATCSCADA